jgi:glycolate oxidase iron-sulfur subunit
MQTRFSPLQLADPDTAVSERVLRACVHCGFCTATCPTYVLLGDELDSPRGRIYLIKDMLERGKAASATVVKHIDRCLSCLSCMSTCPSSVHYMHLVDHARAYIERTHRRPFAERCLRAALAVVLPRPGLFRVALAAAIAVRPVRRALPGRLRAMLDLVPWHLPKDSPVDLPQVFAAEGSRRMRVGLVSGCVQRVLAPEINEATVRLLTRLGCEVVVARGAECCGALAHHLGKHERARANAKANVAAWLREADGDGLDAIVVNASGCGTTIKDYGFMLREDAASASGAARVSALARDVSEVVAALAPLPKVDRTALRVAYHSACSLRHGQGIHEAPIALLGDAGFEVHEPAEGHLCCGSAGTYNLLQSEIAGALRSRKIENIERLAPDVIATGNIGCMTHIGAATAVPVIHTVELLDWASGGPRPSALPG